MRKENWPLILANKIKEHETTGFEYGRCDCWLFAVDVIDAMLGTNIKFDGEGKYTNMLGALKTVKKVYEVDSLEGMASLLFDEVKIKQVGRGDLVMALDSFGICDGYYSLFKREDGKLARIPTMTCDLGWRVE